MQQSHYHHQPVLLSEILALFKASTITTFLDATVGAGGHSTALLVEHPELKRLLGLDRDATALRCAGACLAPWGEVVTLRQGNFAMMADLAAEEGFKEGFDGILMDIGVSSMQIDDAARGFSFQREGPLDMRMGEDSLTASMIVNEWSEEELRRLFWRYGEEPQSAFAARLIMKARPLATTLQLAQALQPLSRREKRHIHPAARVFQALRIAVNDELKALELALPQALKLLKSGGVLAVISFHSLEDRRVKECFREAASDKVDTRGLAGLFLDKTPTVQVLTHKPLCAGADERQANARSQCAKLRAVRKI